MDKTDLTGFSRLQAGVSNAPTDLFGLPTAFLAAAFVVFPVGVGPIQNGAAHDGVLGFAQDLCPETRR
jgi:hypothetical protein